MTTNELAVNINKLLTTPVVFIKLENEMLDYLHNKDFRLCIYGNEGGLIVHITSENFYEVFSLLRTAFFDNKVSVIGWNIKPLFTYVFFRTHMHLESDKQIFDLKVAESFLGIRKSAPVDFEEVKIRVKNVTNDSSWVGYKNLYAKVYLPLITKVIPSIESEGVFDISGKQKLHSFYEVEGTVNGRLSCHVLSSDYFNPHSMPELQRANLAPFGADCSFIYFDLSFMEVAVLAWLCKDEKLMQFLKDDDFYKSLFTHLFGKDCSASQRAIAKNIFLPVVYGEGAKLLASNLKIDVDKAHKIISLLKKTFQQLFSWIDNYPIENDFCIDCFGRKRYFGSEDRYLYRNFIIQSPGAAVCLEKLVKLYKAIGSYGKLVASIHDGYVIKVEDKYVETMKHICIDSLQESSEICPGLNFEVKFKVGKNLS